MAKKCKITVLRKLFLDDLVAEYGAKTLAICPNFEVGQEFITTWKKPDNFCDEAWKAIYQYAFAVSHGVEDWYTDNWIDTKAHKGVAIASCNDGLRPVIFKIEPLED